MHTQLQLNLPEAVYEFWGKYSLIPGQFVYTANYYDATRDHLTLSEEPQYHHYHCGDEDCDYCRLISLAINPSRYQYNGETLADFMTFAQFNAQHPIYFEEVDGERVWYRRNCPTSWSGLKSYAYYGPYKEDEEEDEDYDTYGAGMEIDPYEFDTVEEGWLAPDGTFYYVPDEIGHEGTAKLLLSDEGPYNCYCDILEGRGWIHITDYYGPERFQYVPLHPTKAQIEVANEFAQAHGIEVPESLRYQTPFTESPTIVPFTYWQRVEDSCKPRSFRDRFYPLSGD